MFLETPLVDAIPDTPEAKRVCSFLDEISALDHGDTSQESRDRRTLLEEHFGAGLFGENKLKGASFFVGGGDNGKTLAGNLAQDTLGELSTSFAPSALFSDTPRAQDNQHGHTGGLNQMKDKRAAYCAELNKSSVIRGGIFKAATGGDLISLRGLGKESERVRLSIMLYIMTNHLPRVPDGDPAILKRFYLFDFRNQWADLNSSKGRGVAEARAASGLLALPEADRELANTFKHPSARQAMLRIMVDAAVRFAQNGYKFTVQPPSIDALYAAYERNNNTLLDWLEDSGFELGDGYVTEKEVFHSFRDWLEAGEHNKVSRTTFLDRVKEFLPSVTPCNVIAKQEGTEKDGRPKFVTTKTSGKTPGKERGLHGLVRRGAYLRMVPPADAPSPLLDGTED